MPTVNTALPIAGVLGWVGEGRDLLKLCGRMLWSLKAFPSPMFQAAAKVENLLLKHAEGRSDTWQEERGLWRPTMQQRYRSFSESTQ